MREGEIKDLLRCRLTNEGTFCVEELPICGHVARADIVAIADSLAGYEVKSEYDSLSRLPNQCKAYDQVFEYSTLVVAANHLAEARAIIPKRWGIIKVPTDSEELVEIRKPKRNKEVCGNAVAEFFWQRELIEILSSIESFELRKSWTRKRLRKEVVNAIAPLELAGVAASKMRFRQRWRAA